MRTHTVYLTFNTEERTEFVNITSHVEHAISESKIQEGLALINPMHITAAVYINDDERGLIEDFKVWLEKLAPAKPDYQHHRTGEDNADAHIKRQLMGHQVVVPITNGHLDFGPWEQIFYAEFDGQRPKRVLVKIIGS